jgi:Cu/Ag efflux pump CusA
VDNGLFAGDAIATQRAIQLYAQSLRGGSKVTESEPKPNEVKETISNLLVDGPEGKKVTLSYVAKVSFRTEPNRINRENVSRLIIVSANVNGRDLGSVIIDICDRIKDQVQLRSGYYIQ